MTKKKRRKCCASCHIGGVCPTHLKCPGCQYTYDPYK
jgi:hypothetical protein